MVYLIYGLAGQLCNSATVEPCYLPAATYSATTLHVVGYRLYSITSAIAVSHVCIHTDCLLTTLFLLMLDLMHGMGVSFVLQLLDS